MIFQPQICIWLCLPYCFAEGNSSGSHDCVDSVSLLQFSSEDGKEYYSSNHQATETECRLLMKHRNAKDYKGQNIWSEGKWYKQKYFTLSNATSCNNQECYLYYLPRFKKHYSNTKMLAAEFWQKYFSDLKKMQKHNESHTITDLSHPACNSMCRSNIFSVSFKFLSVIVLANLQL